ncbi:MAG: hypothetical protein ACE5JU_19245 [Candidatus Binatia bacterium]
MSRLPPSVFLDTNLLKFAVDRLDRLMPTEQQVNWGGQTFPADVHVPVTVLPNEAIDNPELKSEVKLLPRIAELAHEGRIRLLLQEEVFIESWRQENMDGPRGPFFGAPITRVNAPVEYGRVVAAGGGDRSGRDLQLDFLKSLKVPRFEQLQKACGAYQGEGKYAENELIDAFFVWCAEVAEADYFLTCDFDLIGHVSAHKRFPPKVELVKPSTLLDVVA